MVKKDGAAASIEENAEVQAPAEEQSNVQSSTAESVETQAPNEEDAEMQALFEGLDGNEPEQSGAEETAPKGKPTRADVLREARQRRMARSESVRAYQEFLTLACPSPHGMERTMPLRKGAMTAIHQFSRSGRLARMAAIPSSKAA